MFIRKPPVPPVHPVIDDGLHQCDSCGRRLPATQVFEFTEYLDFCNACIRRYSIRQYHGAIATWDIVFTLGPERDAPSA